MKKALNFIERETLQSKFEFGSVASLNEKPAVETAGIPTSDSDSCNEQLVPLIVHESPDLHNKKGDAMQNSAFPSFLIALSDYEQWNKARPKHMIVFINILIRLATSTTHHMIGSSKKAVLPGQAYLSIRQIQDYCGPQYSKNDVEGAVKYFKKKNIDFLRQENCKKIRHEKSLFSIRDTACWEIIKRISQTKKIVSSQTTDQTTNQTTNQTLNRLDRLEYLDKESLLSKSNAHDARRPRNSEPGKKTEDFSSKLEKLQASELVEICAPIEDIPGVSITKKMLDECIEIVGTHEAVVEAITAIQRNPDRKFNLTNWPKQLRAWDTAPKKKSAKSNRDENKKIAQKIIDLYSGGNWDLRIAKDPKKGDEGLVFDVKGGSQMEPKFISFSLGKFADECKEFIQKRQIQIPKNRTVR